MARFSKKIYFASTACLFSVWFTTQQTALAQSGTYSLSYSGRLTRADGAPVSGPVDVSVKFWNAADGGNTLGTPIELTNIALNQGVFLLPLELNSAQVSAVFGQGTDPVFIEINAAGKTYPRQQYSFVPFALRVPVDAMTLAFDGDGKLGLSLTSQPSANQFLTKDSNGRLAWGSPVVSALQGQSIASTAPTSGQILTYSGGQWVPQTLAVAGAAGGTVTNVNGTAPITVTTGTTTPVISMAQASGSASGYLSAADWTAFNAKPGTAVTSVSTGTGLSGGPITSSGTISLNNTSVTPGSYTRANISVDAQGRLTAASNGASVNLASEVSGTLPVRSGGTGAASFTNNGILVGSGSLPVSTVTGAQYQVLTASAGGTPSFGSLNLDQSAAVTGILPKANGGTGVNSTATFPSSGVIVTEGATETLSNKTLNGALILASTVNGASLIGGSTTINTTGTVNSGAQTVAGNVTILGNSTTANKLVLNDKGSTNSVAIKAPDTLASSLTLELPSTSGSSGQVLATNGSGILSWVSAATGSVTNVTGTAPISVATGTSTPSISMTQANGTTNGYLSSADWTTFNNKQAAGNYLTGLTGDVTATGPGSSAATLAAVAIAGTSTKVSYDVKGRVTSGTSLEAADLPSHSAALITSGTLATANGGTGANLSTTGGAGQYLKQTTSGGNITVGTIAAGDITSSLGYTPLNKSGDTVTGALNLGANDLVNSGNIQMAASKTLALSTNATDPSGLAASDVGKTWFNSTTNQIKYWNGSAAVALGAAGSGLSNLNGQTGNTQTFAVPGTSGIAPTWSSASNVHTLNIPMASAASVTAGLLSNADYAAFNGKISSVAQGTGITVATASGTATVSLGSTGTAGTYSKVTTDAYGRVSSGTTLTAADIPPLSAAIITSGTLAVANGGTGATTLAANNVILGNGTSAVQTVAPGTSGNVLTSNGTTWTSTTLPASVTSVTGTAPISVATGTSTPVISMAQASGTTNGYLSSADWTTFSSKQASGNYITALTGDVTAAGAGSAAATLSTTGVTAGTYTKVTVDAKGRATAGTSLIAADIPPLPTSIIGSGTLGVANGGTGAATITNNGVVIGAGTGALSGVTGTSGQVMTVNGSNQPIFSAINLASSAAVSGTLAVANGGTGASTLPTNNVLLGNGTSALQAVAPGASGNVLLSNGTTWTSAASSTNWAVPGTIGSTTPNTGAFTTLTASGNVGIGTTSPAMAVDISGNSAVNNGVGLRLFNGAGTNTNQWYLGTGGNTVASSAFSIGDKSAYRLVINNSGNVGIGTTNPQATLEINGDIKKACPSGWTSAGNFCYSPLQTATSGHNTQMSCSAMGYDVCSVGQYYYIAQGDTNVWTNAPCTGTAWTWVTVGSGWSCDSWSVSRQYRCCMSRK